MEQPAEGAAAGSDPPPELGQRGVVRGLLVQHRATARNRSSVGSGRCSGLFGSLVELVDEDAVQAGAGAAVDGRAARAGEGEQDFAGEVGGA